MIFNITPLDSSLKFLWVRCNVHKPRIVYARQTDDFVVKNAKNTIFSTFMTTFMTSRFTVFNNNTIGFLVKIPMG